MLKYSLCIWTYTFLIKWSINLDQRMNLYSGDSIFVKQQNTQLEIEHQNQVVFLFNEQKCTAAKTFFKYFMETVSVLFQEKTICIRGLFNKHF